LAHAVEVFNDLRAFDLAALAEVELWIVVGLRLLLLGAGNESAGLVAPVGGLLLYVVGLRW
jgi:hypothetical protein